jgi:hypothetical protein
LVVRFKTFFILVLAAVGCSSAFCQTVSVQQFGAKGDGSTDDAAAIQNAINNAPAGSTIDFGNSSNVYLVGTTILLQSNRNYTGSATIRMSGWAASGSPLLSLRDPQPSNVSINGLTLDGNSVGNIFIVDFANNTTALLGRNIAIQNTTVVNSVGQYAFYSPGTLDQATFNGNMFSNCTGGIAVFSPDHMTIVSNQFDTITRDNAITVMFNATPVEYGQSLVIANNVGENMARMGVEVIGDAPTKPGSIYVNQNVFTNWLPSAGDSFFGISVFTGTNPQIVGNVVQGAGTIGIEVGAAGAVVADNLITDFALGTTIEAPNTVFQSNHFLNNSNSAIYVTNSRYSKQGTTISGNYISEAHTVGINISTTNWQGSQVTGNAISRSNSWPDDSNGVFTGIGITPPLGGVLVASNSIVLKAGASKTIPGFIGIRINGDAGTNSQSRYDSNTIRTTGGVYGIGVYANSPGSLDGVILTNNSFTSLARATDGAPGQNPVIGGNSAVHCQAMGTFNLF